MTQLLGFLPTLAVEAAAASDQPLYTVEKLGPVLQLLHKCGFESIVDFFQVTLGFESSAPPLVEIFFATLLTFMLTALIASLYKVTFRGPKLSQDYAHTLMILGIVVTVIVMCVREGEASKAQATAFGMFAAFSIIRFRTTLSEARDIGFIFLAMAAGLAVGARQYGLAVSTVMLICAIIYYFSKRDWFAPNRASHFLRVRVTNDISYDTAFDHVFQKYLEKFDLISVESIQAGMMTELRYGISLRAGQKPGEFVGALQQVNGNNRVFLSTTAPTRTLGTE